jgi:hypothetical protein
MEASAGWAASIRGREESPANHQDKIDSRLGPITATDMMDGAQHLWKWSTRMDSVLDDLLESVPQYAGEGGSDRRLLKAYEGARLGSSRWFRVMPAASVRAPRLVVNQRTWLEQLERPSSRLYELHVQDRVYCSAHMLLWLGLPRELVRRVVALASKVATREGLERLSRKTSRPA